MMKQIITHLGITFQSSATWKTHIDDIYKKACSRLFLLRQVKHLLDRYFAFIRPVLEYGDVVWGNCTKKESDLLESVQIEANYNWSSMYFLQTKTIP